MHKVFSAGKAKFRYQPKVCNWEQTRRASVFMLGRVSEWVCWASGPGFRARDTRHRQPVRQLGYVWRDLNGDAAF